MMFKRPEKGDKEGTRSERWRSKSVEHIYDASVVGGSPAQAKKRLKNRAATSSGNMSKQDAPAWREVDKLKGVAPVVACVLPSLAMDFVASSLLAVGAVPLITEGKIFWLELAVFTWHGK